MNFDWTQGAPAEGLRQYEAGEFLAAHEAWESVWLRSQEPEKTFLQGLIQVTAALHHLQRSNRLGTALLLKTALQRLQRYPAGFGGVSVTLLCNDIRERLQALETGEPAPRLISVRIRPQSCQDQISRNHGKRVGSHFEPAPEGPKGAHHNRCYPAAPPIYGRALTSWVTVSASMQFVTGNPFFVWKSASAESVRVPDTPSIP